MSRLIPPILAFLVLGTVFAIPLVQLGALPMVEQTGTSASGWKRLKVLNGDRAIVGAVDVADPSWHHMRFRWTCPCSNQRTLELIASPKEKGPRALASERATVMPTGEYVFAVPQGTGQVVISLSGNECSSALQLEVFAPYAPSKTEFEYDFRQTKWGMSKEQVIAAEGKPGHDEPDRLLYQTEVAGLKAGIAFEFVNGKLARATYVLMERYAEPNQYIINSERWVEALKEKYGEPRSDVRWLNDLYRNDQKKYAFAISAGHLVIRNSWETERTKIQHIVNGQNFAISVGIAYTSKELEAELEKKAKEAQKTVF